MTDTWNSSDKFNREARQWDENPQRRVLAHTVAKAIIAAAKPTKSMLALELGCGTGLVTLEIAQLVKMLYAVDTCGITNIDVSRLDFLSSSESVLDDKRFDLIYSSMTLHHIDNTAGLLNRISRLLAPGGITTIADLDQEDGLFHDDPLEKVHHGFDREELAAILRAAGLEATSFETIHAFNKTNRSGVTAAYPVFLVTAAKKL